MSQTVGDYFWARMKAWGVRTVFGYPGDGINGLLGALSRTGDDFQFIQVRHEEMAAFMASAYAKFTGELGVCLATSGPGASHLITGLYDARMDHMPVLAIVGQQARAAIGGHYQQELDLLSMFKDVAGAFMQQASTAPQTRHLVDRAVRIAKAERRVTAFIFPNDLQDLPYEEPPRKHGTVHSGVGYSAPKVVPYEADLRRAAEALNAGEKVAILVGAGALGAIDEVIAVADRLQAGAAKALLGKAALPDDLPWVTGSIGLLGTKPSYDLMMDCDTLLMIGSGFPYSEFMPKEGQARGVQIDIEPGMLSLRYPMEVPLVGDSAETLRALLPLLDQKTDRSWREEVERNTADWWQLMEDRALAKANPVNPQRVTWELSPRLPDRVIVTSDSGSCANDAGKDFFGGYCWMAQGPLPMQWAGTLTGERGLWGDALLGEMAGYNHLAGLKNVGEYMPQERNRVTLADEIDQHGLPIPRITHSLCDNDKRLAAHSVREMRASLEAAGGRAVWEEWGDTCHLGGTCRMGDDPRSSVIDADCRSWDIPNLWICDGSVFPTVGGVNPSLTIQAVALRTADRITAMAGQL